MEEWGLSLIFGGVGACFLISTYVALILRKKGEHKFSGVPFYGGLLLIIGGLLSPIKWLALLGFLDYGILGLPYFIIKDLIKINKNKEKLIAAMNHEKLEDEGIKA